MSGLPYQLLADAVLVLHVAIVVFVAGGLIVIVVGNLVAWDWVNALWLRLAHLSAIAIVVAEAWYGAVCPLTSLEMRLRAKARATTYAGSFIEHWLQSILYYEAPAWVFTLGYTLFGLIVAATWWYFPPRFKRQAVTTSGRKLRTHSVGEMLRVLARVVLRGPRAVKQRQGLELWYAERREDPRKNS